MEWLRGKMGLQFGLVEGMAFIVKEGVKVIFRLIDMGGYGFAVFRGDLR